MPVPGDPPATTLTAWFKQWMQDVVDAIADLVSGKADDTAVVHDTGAETIAGVKTFSSDPIIPDEAYGSGWNGVLEPPTKNAVYDKIETIATPTKQWIGAPRFGNVEGSPVMAGASSLAPVWSLDQTTIEAIGVNYDFTSLGWATFDVDLYWGGFGVSGNVVWRFDYVSASEGESIASPTTGTNRTAASPAGGQFDVQRLESGLAVPSGGDVFFCRVRRMASDGADTLAGDAGVIGVMLTKAS